MSVSVSVNGTSYTIPQTGETGWGAQVTAWIQAVSSATLQKNGGTFTLTADADFGASFGLKSAYYKSRSAAISTAGLVRLASTESIGWRNAGDSANLLLLPKSGANGILTYGGIDLVDVSTAQSLTNKGLSGCGLSGCTVGGDLSFLDAASGSTPSAGLHNLYSKTDGNMYIVDSAGLESPVATGTASINYVKNGKFEGSAITGWATYADAAGTSPVNGTGGSPTVTFATTSSSPLRGSGSGLFTKDAADRQGEGFSYDFTVDTADVGSVVEVSFEYLTSAAYASNDMSVWLYDVTNSALVSAPTYLPYQLAASSSSVNKFSTLLKLTATGTAFRLIFHVASTNASAYTVKIDSVSVTPSDKVVVSATQTGLSVSNTTTTAMACTSTAIDPWGAFDQSTGIFTVPVSGLYHVITKADSGATFTSGSQITLSIAVSTGLAATYSDLYIYYSTTSGISTNGSTQVYLPKGATMTLNIFQSSGGSKTIGWLIKIAKY